MEEYRKEDEEVTNKKCKIVIGTNKKIEEDNEASEQCNDYGIHFTEELPDNEDLFDTETTQVAKESTVGSSSGLDSNVKDNKGKETRMDGNKIKEEFLADELHSPQHSDDDTFRSCMDTKFD